MALEMSADEKRIRQRLKDDFKHYATKCLKIRTKAGKIEPFTLNKAQLYIHEQIEWQRGQTGRVRALILKGRQQGASTYIGGRFYWRTTHSYGMQTFILTHALDATANLYKMAQRFYDNTPAPVRPQVSTNNSKELIFGVLDSGYKIGTAENKSVGRSSTIQLFHGSEVAFWANSDEHAKGILQAVPDANGTEIVLESTANGVGGFYHQQWQKAEAGLSEYIAIFVPWYWQEEYRKPVPESFEPTPEEIELIEIYGVDNEQLSWRRSKIQSLSVSGVDGEKAFKQEYPFNANEAFQLTGEDSYIESDIVIKARKAQAEKYGPLIISCDPARFGDDRTSIVRRQGRVAYGLESYVKKDTMEVVGILQKIIEAEKPYRLAIDVGGLGAGIVDRLHELGHREIVYAVNSGSKPFDAKRYYNKRAEMWGELKEWLLDEPCQIPDSDSLHADLCGLKYKYDSNSRLRMESKDDAKKRGIRSPDEADALCFLGDTLIQTPKGKVRIDSLKVGDVVTTPLGITKIGKVWVSETDLITTATFTNGSHLSGKGAHKIFTWETGECRLDELSFTFEVEQYSKWGKIKWWMLKQLLIEGRSSEFKPLVDTINRTIGMGKSAFYIVACGLIISALSLKVLSFITKIKIGATTIFPTLKLCEAQIIRESICANITLAKKIEKKIESILVKLSSKQKNGTDRKRVSNGINSMESRPGKTESQSINYALSAEQVSFVTSMQNFALENVVKKDAIQSKKRHLKFVYGAIKSFWRTNIAKWRVAPSSVQTVKGLPITVYNLTLEKHNAYYANGILVFNCLTFALPQSALDNTASKQRIVSKRLASNFKNQLDAISAGSSYAA